MRAKHLGANEDTLGKLAQATPSKKAACEMIRRIVQAASILPLILQTALAASPSQNPMQAVPPQFQGDWNSKVGDCDSNVGSNDSALSIGAHWIRFYESGGPILAVIMQGNSHLSIIARLTGGEDPGETWGSPMKFNLSENGAVLTDETSPDSKMVRYKCPHHSSYPPKPKR